MAVTANEVKIVVSVEDAGSASTLSQIENNLQSVGKSAEASGQRVARGMSVANDGITNSLDNVRLFSQELGLRMPRAMEHAMSRAQGLTTILNGVSGGFLALGAIEIGAHMVQELHGVYEKYLDVNAAQRTYDEELMKSRTQDFGNTHSIENTRARIQSATEDIQALNRAIQGVGSNQTWYTKWILPNTFEEQANAADFAKLIPERERQRQQLIDAQGEQQHELTLQAIARDHSSVGLTGAAARRAELQRKLAENVENRSYHNEQDKRLHNLTVSNAGDAEWQMQDRLARQDFDQQTAKDHRDQELKTWNMQSEAREAAMHGEAVYEEQRLRAEHAIRAEIEETNTSKEEGLKQIAALDARFDAERRKRLELERQEIQLSAAEAALTGFRGMGRIQAQGDIDIGKIRGNLDWSEPRKDQEVAAVKMRVDQELLQAERQYSEQADAVADGTADHQISAIGRIRAEAQRAINEKHRAYEDQIDHLDRSRPEGERAYQSATATFQKESGAVTAGADQQIFDLRRQYEQETEQMESQARAKELAAHKQQTGAIENEYEERFRKIEEWRERELSSQKLTNADREDIQDQASRREFAAFQERNAEMLEAARSARERMSGELSGLFRSFSDHPTEGIKELGGKIAGQIGAAGLQRVQNHFGGAISRITGAQPGESPWQHVLDRIAGAPAGTVANSSSVDYASGTVLPPALRGRSSSAGRSSIALASAEIHIGTASLAISGFGAAAATGASSYSSAGGYSGAPGGGYGAGSSVGAPGGSALAYGGSYGGRSASGSNYPGDAAASSTLYTGSGASGGGFYGTGSAGSTHSAIASGVGYVHQGAALYQQADSIFGPKGAAALGHDSSVDNVRFDKNGNQIEGGSGAGMLNGGGFAANAMGAAGGAIGLYSAFEGGGGIGGAASGAMSGMELGMSLGGPMGAAIGAIGGAIIGAIGFGGREKARVWWLKNGRNRMQNDTDSFQQGGMDYLSAMADIEQLKADANHTTNAMGKAAEGYYQDTIKAEIAKAEDNLTREQKAGRSQFGASAASYAVGSDYIPSTGFNLNHEGERIIPSDQNKRITRALEASTKMPAASSLGGDVHLHVHAMDTKGVKQFLFENKHGIRAALNSSYAENSGGADTY